MQVKRDHVNLDYAKTQAEYLSSNIALDQRIDCILKTMQKYGDDRWWENKDERVLAYYQVNEPMLIIPWEIFDRGLQNLLERKITNQEYAFSVNQLKAEAQIKFKELIKG